MVHGVTAVRSIALLEYHCCGGNYLYAFPVLVTVRSARPIQKTLILLVSAAAFFVECCQMHRVHARIVLCLSDH